MTARGAIDPMVLEEAADWLMRLSEGALAPEEQAQWLHWRSSNSECERAWQRAEGLLGKLGGLPPALAMPALNRPRGLARRAVLARLAALLALGPAAWGGWQLNQRQGWSADYHAAVGERRALRLGDGSQVTLNTDTSLDVRFDARERLLVLRRGEILVQTAADAQQPGRPLRVMTDQGRLEALAPVSVCARTAGKPGWRSSKARYALTAQAWRPGSLMPVSAWRFRHGFWANRCRPTSLWWPGPRACWWRTGCP